MTKPFGPLTLTMGVFRVTLNFISSPDSDPPVKIPESAPALSTFFDREKTPLHCQISRIENQNHFYIDLKFINVSASFNLEFKLIFTSLLTYTTPISASKSKVIFRVIASN